MSFQTSCNLRLDTLLTATNHVFSARSLVAYTSHRTTGVHSFEVVAGYVHRSGFNATVVVIYRPGSQDIAQCFFDNLSSLLSTATFASPLTVAGDLNVHADDASDTIRNKLLALLAVQNLVQHASTPTHVRGHTLDLWSHGTIFLSQYHQLTLHYCLIMPSSRLILTAQPMRLYRPSGKLYEAGGYLTLMPWRRISVTHH